jgi:hypothetical protein
MVRTRIFVQAIDLLSILASIILCQTHLRGTLSNIFLQADQHWRAAVPHLLDALVAFLNEQVVDFLESQVCGLWVEEVDQRDEGEVSTHEDEVGFPGELGMGLVCSCSKLYSWFVNVDLVTYAGNERWAYHHNNEVLGGC